MDGRVDARAPARLGTCHKSVHVGYRIFGLLALLQPARQLNLPGALLGIIVLLCAATTFRSTAISSFLKIFLGIFSTETIVFGLARVGWQGRALAG